MDVNVFEISPESAKSKSARKKQRAKERDAKLKENDIEEWERKRKHKSEYNKIWRKLNPDKCREYGKRNEEKRKLRSRRQEKTDSLNLQHHPPSPLRRMKDIAFCDKTDYSERGFM